MIHSIDTRDIPDQYLRRGLDQLSDTQLCQQAAAIICSPVKDWNSFILHAPLELLARLGLLPMVEPRYRTLARQQIIASAASYPGDSIPRPPGVRITPFKNPADGIVEFARSFHAGDPDALEAIMLQFASQFGVPELVHVLTPLALPALSGASHSHIGLWLLLRHGRSADTGDAALLRAAARALAGDPRARLASFGGLDIAGDRLLAHSPAEVERDVFARLATAPRGKQAYGSMHHLLTAGEATGNADALFSDFIRHDLTDQQIDAAFRAIMRVCAHNMLQHDTAFAKFGWSHCLTLPQAACGLSSFGIDRKRALAAALVWTTAYRSVLSDHDLDPTWSPPHLSSPGTLTFAEALQTSSAAAASRAWYADPPELPSIQQALATQASIRPDQHLVKYTRACLDMTWFDPSAQRLYLAAAAHLCSLWTLEQPGAMAESGLFQRG